MERLAASRNLGNFPLYGAKSDLISAPARPEMNECIDSIFVVRNVYEDDGFE